MNTRIAKTLASAALLALAVAGCGSDNGGGGGGGGGGDTASSDLELINSGQLTVCSDVPYPPFDTRDGGEYTGFDGDLMNEIASGLDLELVLKDQAFEGLQSGLALNSRQCDIVAAAMTITEERKQNLAFADPYYDSKQSLLVPEGSDITSIEDLSGKKVGVQQGTTGKMYAEENAPSDAELISFPSDGEMYPAIQAGQVDALLQDLPVNLSHEQDGGYMIVEEYDTGEQYGFAVRKEGAENLLQAVNDQLQELRDNGTYDELYDKYFSTGN
jgi:polar amino acid transport system substrate-binding protein